MSSPTPPTIAKRMIAKTIRKPQLIGLVPLIRMFFLDVLGGGAQGWR